MGIPGCRGLGHRPVGVVPLAAARGFRRVRRRLLRGGADTGDAGRVEGGGGPGPPWQSDACPLKAVEGAVGKLWDDRLRESLGWRSLAALGMASSKISTAGHYVTTRPQAPMKAGGNGAAWVPNMDVFTHEGGVVVKAELAGIRREDLTLTVEGNRLRIRGQRRDAPRAPGSRFLMMEIEYGAFEASVELPPGLDMGTARAVYLNGFLRIEFARAEAAEGGPQRIEVA